MLMGSRADGLLPQQGVCDHSGAVAGRDLGSSEGLLGTPGNPILQWERD